MQKQILKIDCKKIFFDFDGVIVDSNNFKEQAIKESVQKQNLEKRLSNDAIAFFNENAGLGRKQKLLQFFNETIVDKVLLDYSRKCLIHFSKATPTKGFYEFLNSLKINFPDIKLYILSGGNINEILYFLEFNKMSNFFYKVLYDNCSKKQHLINERAQYKDLFFGDSKNDLYAAKNHPLSFILVRDYGSAKSRPKIYEEKFAKVSINDFSNIQLIV